MNKKVKVPEINLGDNYNELDKARIRENIQNMRLGYCQILKEARQQMDERQKRADQFAKNVSKNKLPLYKSVANRSATSDDFVINPKWAKLGEYDLYNETEASGWVCEHCGTREYATFWEDDGRGGSIYHYGCNCVGAKQSGKPRLLDSVK